MDTDFIIFLIGLGFLGLAFGSFLNVVIYRLPIMLKQTWRKDCLNFLELNDPSQFKEKSINLALPASHCPHCHKKLRVSDNIPLLSFLILKGRCRYCNHRISPRYPIVELLTLLITLLLGWLYGQDFKLISSLCFSYALIVLAFIDLKHKFLPDNITIPLLWLGLIINLFNTFTTIQSAVVGAIMGYLVLWFINQLFKLTTKKEGMGYGDFKLAGMLGAWCGYHYLLLIFLLSSLIGLVVGLLLIFFKKHDRNIPIPFGPYLAIAGFIALNWGYLIKLLLL